MMPTAIGTATDSASWPRFREIPEPRMVCLHAGHGSGSKAFQSYLDGHPQIYMIPAYPLVYLYPHWRRWQREMKSNWTWPAIIDAFCVQHASVIDPKNIPGHDGMTTLGENRDDRVAIDSQLYRAVLKRLLQDEPISSRAFVLAVHYAYAFCRGQDFGPKRVLVYHIHVQAYVSTYLIHDFPDMLILGMARDQRSNHRGRYFHSIANVQNQKLNRSDAILLRRRNYYEVCRLLYHPETSITGAPLANIRVVRAEDLHLGLEEMMRAVAVFLGIDFHPCLLQSTFGGLLFWGDAVYDMQPMNRVNPRMVSLDWQETLAPMDWFVLEGLFHDYHKTYGYPQYKYTDDTWVNRAKLFFLMLLPSQMERQAFLNYLKPAILFEFVTICWAEATGRTPLKDYSFNAYYRHRWGSEDLMLWRPRWYKRFLVHALGDANKARPPLVAAAVKWMAQACYIGVNLGRYGWAVLTHPYWLVVKRWPLSFSAFRRLVAKTFVLPKALP